MEKSWLEDYLKDIKGEIITIKESTTGSGNTINPYVDALLGDISNVNLDERGS